MNPYNPLCTALCFFLLIPVGVWSQPKSTPVAAPSSPTIFQYLVANQLSQVTITADFTTLMGDKKKPHILDATLLLEDGQGYQDTMGIKIELRGRTRRKVCSVPPMNLDFSKKRLVERGFQEVGDKLKLVTHCNDEYGIDYLLREYWAYRAYNELTPVSFQVHLVQIKYVDTAAPDEIVEGRMGFIIESEEELAARFNAKDENIWGLTSEVVDKKSYHYSVLFQYMIGNDDWGMTSPRNLSFLQPLDGGFPLIVPYDFDFSGLVNAPYAIANPNLNGKNVLDRVVIGQFASKEDLQSVMNDFLQAKERTLNCYQSCAWMTNGSKKKMQKYLNGFYRELDNPKKMERLFLNGN